MKAGYRVYRVDGGILPSTGRAVDPVAAAPRGRARVRRRLGVLPAGGEAGAAA